MNISTLLTDEATLAELGQRLAALRLARGLPQDALAREAGISTRTLQRLEDGSGAQLVNLVRCLRALGRLEALDALLPATASNPLDLLERRGRPRQRARRAAAKPAAASPWVWGDER